MRFGLVAIFRKLGDQTMDQTEDDSIPHVQNTHCDVVTRTVIGIQLTIMVCCKLSLSDMLVKAYSKPQVYYQSIRL